MTKRARTVWQGFLHISLWLASIGLMLASSGIDGAYLAKLMPTGWAWLGLVLNTVSDIASEVMMYWYGRLQMDASKIKQKKSRWILLVVALLVGYAWLFSWRQLLPPLVELEERAAIWLAPLMAAFVPISLAGIGYVQALLAGRIEKERAPSELKAETKPEPQPAELANPFQCPHCDRSFATRQALNAHKRVHKQAKSNGHSKQSQQEPAEAHE